MTSGPMSEESETRARLATMRAGGSFCTAPKEMRSLRPSSPTQRIPATTKVVRLELTPTISDMCIPERPEANP